MRIFSKKVCGVGITGNEYLYDNEGNLVDSYICWSDMLRRCYNIKSQKKRNTYIGCNVCEEWFEYKNFRNWYDLNFYKLEDHRIHLDKDILVKGNKTYSPETCIFAPQFINSLFVKSNKTRGGLPIGISWDKEKRKYRSYCSINNKTKNLGSYKTIEESFNAYKKYKEQHIKNVADEYKDRIPKKLYDAMYKYKVEMVD